MSYGEPISDKQNISEFNSKINQSLSELDRKLNELKNIQPTRVVDEPVDK
ncbi:MAG: hypothetical protein WDN66_03300 [Candidatus Saccharibacteria bacterium]